MRSGSSALQKWICFVFVLAEMTWSAFPARGADASGQASSSIWQWDHLTNDWNGNRTALENKGIKLTLNYISEAMDVASGGVRQGAAYEGRLDINLDLDFEKMGVWPGGSGHVTVYQIHDLNDRNIADEVGSLGDPSNIDALPTTRLFTAWLQQTFAGGSFIKFGQVSADEDFATSNSAGKLLNGAFGWPVLFASDMTSGGPAYPLATLGAVSGLYLKPQLVVRGGLFSGNPAGGGCQDDPQVCDRHGTTFSSTGGALLMAELAYELNPDGEADGPSISYKLGGWYHTNKFADERYGLSGSGNVVSLASSEALSPIMHAGNWGVYALVDRTIYQGGDNEISAFLRGQFAPSDRNLVAWGVDAGLAFTGVLPSRKDDTLTLGVSHSGISRAAAGLDKDTAAETGTAYPVRSGETVFEVSYNFAPAPWWNIQPDIQYIINPGAGAADDSTGKAIPNAFVFGVRSTIDF